MKLHGKTLQANEEVVVIPRQSGDLVFKARAVLNYDDHDRVNPQPKPPTKLLPGGETSQNIEDPRYKKRLNDWSLQKFHWLFLKSIEATDGLEWETVEMGDPETWGNYRKEMEEAGLSPTEVANIEMCVSNACGLNQAKIDEATKRFLAGPRETRESQSSQNTVPANTTSGEPASVGG